MRAWCTTSSVGSLGASRSTNPPCEPTSVTDMSKAYPSRATITEVGLRDGLQMESQFVPTEQKLKLLHALIEAGVRRFEATSFVSPRAVPQLADAADLMRQVGRSSDVTLAVLAPNAKGIARALEARADEVIVFISASETHNLKNLNRSRARSLDDMREAADMVRGTGVHLHAAIAVAYGCPFEGEVALEEIERLASAFAELGFDGITLGDTTGMATPRLVRQRVEMLQRKLPQLPVTLHFHNTRGIGLVNVMAGLECGVTSFESSLGGIGGCPFAPGATGNICTEDMVHLLAESGVETGIDLAALCDVARDLEQLLGRALPGQVMHAGPRLRRYAADEALCAAGS
ncbi:hydroxymethylglutaryl-CoA lyase [Ramlibacter sp.]|uniref:hydroxymethylglutaryl-CoA lyase n=1 Tax=Ramlibacter sp. TaxID=1917967 RepID=UPI003D139C10